MTDKKEEALKLALGYMNGTLVTDHLTGYERKRYVMEAIRETLAEQPAQQQDIDWKDQYEQQKRRAEMWIAKYEADIKPLEKAGPVTAQQQEPVAWLHNGKLHEVDPIDWATGTVTPLYPSAQLSKPWVGLTEDQKTAIRREHYARTLPLMEAVEQALMENNT